MEFDEFNREFVLLTGYSPLSWQWRLYRDYVGQGQFPAAIDIPTGLGKTAVMAHWLIAVREGINVPRRLEYVVDRRAVVDQATEFAERIRNRLPEVERFPISTIRGQYADNREWLDDPSKPAIIVGTVDMIGSRLLFEGYGVSRKMRPYHAGILGADCLIVLDEAHLVPPFERLIETIETGDAQFAANDDSRRAIIPRLRLLSLSATGRERQGEIFSLTNSDLDEPHIDQPVTRKRVNAIKTLSLSECAIKELPLRLVEEVWALTDGGSQPVRCLIFCNSRDQAEKIYAELEKKKKQWRKNNPKKGPIESDLFIGARRGYERERAEERLKYLGFLAGTVNTFDAPRFLIATSAGEVGVDLDADHMACDLVAWERMVQRLGRVNRRGDGAAKVVVVDAGPQIPKRTSATETKRMESLHLATMFLLNSLPELSDGVDASPEALRKLKLVEGAQFRKKITEAMTSAPFRPALTRPLVDAWSMTSLKEHTGRPEIAPWLRGWIDDEPQTSVIWRSYLPVPDLELDKQPGWQKEAEKYFEAAPPHVLEQIQTETYRVVNWLIARLKKLENRKASESAPRNLVNEIEEPRIPPMQDFIFVLSAAGDLIESISRENLLRDDKKRLVRDFAGKVLILHSAIGGCTDQGTLHPNIESPPAWVGDDDLSWSEEQRLPESRAIRWCVRCREKDEFAPAVSGWRERFRFVLKRDVNGETLRQLVVYKWQQDAANEDDRAIGRNQDLIEHQSWAAECARRMGEELQLPKKYVNLLVLAARLHDEGKQTERWQKAFNASREKRPLAKTTGPVNISLLDGYRHEFGSLFFAERDAEFQLLSKDDQEFVLHLIAAHHGFARPMISVRGCEVAPPSVLEKRAHDVAMRFARLQRTWGPWGLAWWESLLRAADQQASKDNERHAELKEQGEG